MSRSRRKGSSFERLIADGFAAALNDDRIDRAPLRGAADRGDIANLRNPFGRVVVECKNVARLDLAGWVTEAETERGNADANAAAVIVKRRGKGKFLDQYVVLTVRDFLAFGWGIDATEPDRDSP